MDPQPYFRIFNPYNQSEKVCAPRCMRHDTDNQPRLTLLEITFESSFLSLAVCAVQVRKVFTNGTTVLSLFQVSTNPLLKSHGG